MSNNGRMRCNRKDFDGDINEILGFISDNLPAEWEIELYANRDEVGFNLILPDGDHSSFWPDDEDHIGHWIGLLNHAREVEGLEPVQWPSDIEE